MINSVWAAWSSCRNNFHLGKAESFWGLEKSSSAEKMRVFSCLYLFLVKSSPRFLEEGEQQERETVLGAEECRVHIYCFSMDFHVHPGPPGCLNMMEKWSCRHVG